MKKKQGIKGSLTVEASFVFPLFFFCVLFFLSIICITIIQEQIQKGLNQVALEAVRYAHIYEMFTETSEDEKKGVSGEVISILNSLTSASFYKNKFTEYIDERIVNSNWIEGGVESIDFTDSQFLQDKEHIIVSAKYTVKIPFLFYVDFKMEQHVKARGYVGRSYLDCENEKEDYVYITEHGTVYHKTESCSHLDLSIQKVTYSQLEKLRNKSGGKYYICDKCKKIQDHKRAEVYITDYGDSYHITLNCSGLKRTIQRVKLNEVKGRSPCKKCYCNGGE